MRYDRTKAIAHVTEKTGDPTLGEDSCTALAVFSAFVDHPELPEPDGYEPGPQRVPAEEAIAWARAGAAVCAAARAVFRVRARTPDQARALARLVYDD